MGAKMIRGDYEIYSLIPTNKMSSLDINVITNIITFLAPNERQAAIITFDHHALEDYYQGILHPSDLIISETYRLKTEDVATLVNLAMAILTIDEQKKVFDMFVGGSLKDLLTSDIIDCLCRASWIIDNDVNKIYAIAPLVHLMNSEVYWDDANDENGSARFNHVSIMSAIGRLTDDCFKAIRSHGTGMFCRNVYFLINPHPALIDL